MSADRDRDVGRIWASDAMRVVNATPMPHELTMNNQVQGWGRLSPCSVITS